MAVLVMQSLGCDVAPLNTVHFSELLAIHGAVYPKYKAYAKTIT